MKGEGGGSTVVRWSLGVGVFVRMTGMGRASVREGIRATTKTPPVRREGVGTHAGVQGNVRGGEGVGRRSKT